MSSDSIAPLPSQQKSSNRGQQWFRKLTGDASICKDYPASVLIADVNLLRHKVRYLAVVPDAENRFPRARAGEVGLVEGWQLARAVHEVVVRDQATSIKTPLIAIVDVPGQAYGRREEAYGIHQALAAAAGAYAEARLAGHPVIALIVGKAMSGAFLAHGYQANRLIAFDNDQVMVHAMGKVSAARITLRSVDDLEALAESIPPMAYDIKNFATLGLLWKLLAVTHPDDPQSKEVDMVQQTLLAALESIAVEQQHDLVQRLGAKPRQASAKIRQMLQAQWSEATS